jgi:hypothetical protein
MRPYIHTAFASVSVILEHLSSYPEKWEKYDCSIECFESSKNFCKIYTKQGMFNYIVVNQDVVLSITLVEKFKLWKAIRKIIRKEERCLNR